jgi:hypothetical protein
MLWGAYSSPQAFWEGGGRFDDYGIGALFLHGARVDAGVIARAAGQGARVYAEFGTFRGDYLLERHPDVAPVGRDGLPAPRTARFLGACPTCPGLSLERWGALRRLVREQAVAGVWLDYLHFHCDFEVPDGALALDDTCFCDRCVGRFGAETGLRPAGRTTAERAAWVLAEAPEAWADWKCDLLAGVAAAARRLLDEERPGLRLGVYCAPWTDDDYGGALRRVLGNDLDRLHAQVDVFSPMLYQVKCGRPVEWVEAHTRWLVGRIGALNARRGRRVEVWPIVEAEGATGEELEAVLRGAAAGGATGVQFYALPHVAADPAKLAAVRRVCREG